MNSRNILYIVIWLLIGLILIILYSFEYELWYVWDRVKINLMPKHYYSKSKTERIILKREKDGHFYLNAKLNGKAIRFLIDTGATHSFLSIEATKSLGINLSQLSFNKIYQTANGTTRGAAFQVKTFTLGKIKLKNPIFHVGENYQGISLLGMDIIRLFDNFMIDNDHLIIN
ncbi:MAG: TIGR02281 family clan AA aspartic protease [Rickettsia sp.]|nr:TIGR02281 family clan AA aspartic protease [Rickettsia sp.]